MATVTFQNVWKRYGGVEAVKDLNLKCPNGEMLALLGPSGCGKSSILKMVAGVEEVSAGDIKFDATSVIGRSPGARNIAMVFEDYALYPHLSARQNIAFPLKVRRVKKDIAAQRISEIITLLRLEDVADRKVDQLSGGAQQRISIGRALVRDPDLILFDEPLSHLDGDQKVQLRTEIKRLQQTAALTSILVTHDQSEAISMADRIAVMDHGVLQQVGTPDDLYARPANLFVANFIGEPPMNQCPVSVSVADTAIILAHQDWQTRGRLSALEVTPTALTTRSVIIGVRPEHVHLSAEPVAADGHLSDGITATVTRVEPNGDSDNITLRCGDGSHLVAEIDGPSGWHSGAAIWAAFDLSKTHFFDASSGAAITKAAP